MSNATDVKMYSIYDKKTATFLTPTVHFNDDEAKRMLDHALYKRTAELLCDYPDDYALYSVGTWNSREGAIKVILPPVFITEVSALPSLKKQKNENTN